MPKQLPWHAWKKCWQRSVLTWSPGTNSSKHSAHAAAVRSWSASMAFAGYSVCKWSRRATRLALATASRISCALGSRLRRALAASKRGDSDLLATARAGTRRRLVVGRLGLVVGRLGRGLGERVREGASPRACGDAALLPPARAGTRRRLVVGRLSPPERRLGDGVREGARCPLRLLEPSCPSGTARRYALPWSTSIMAEAAADSVEPL
ncbi:MAG: hypothetical protein ACYTFZ_06645 [Planctomycetota bacterium]